MLRYSWPSPLKEMMVAGVQGRTLKPDALSAILARLCPPYTILTFGDDPVAAAKALFERFTMLRNTPIAAYGPTEISNCGNLYVARSNWSARFNKECRVLQHIAQRSSDAVNITNFLSSFFTEDLRLAATSARSRSGLSPAQFWAQHTAKVLQGAMQWKQKTTPAAWTVSVFDLSSALYYEVASCQQFRPQVAMHMMQGARKILDPCGGWGDRLIAALAAGAETVVVVDPFEALHERYDDIAAVLGDDVMQAVHLVQSCFEDIPSATKDPTHVVNAHAPYDVVVTSPPFFTRETYCDATNQSAVRYPTLDAWVTRFLVPMIVGSLVRVRVGGIVAIAMADFVVRAAPPPAAAGAAGGGSSSSGSGSGGGGGGGVSCKFTADAIRSVAHSFRASAFLGVVMFSNLSRTGETKWRPQPFFVWQRVAKPGVAGTPPSWMVTPDPPGGAGSAGEAVPPRKRARLGAGIVAT